MFRALIFVLLTVTGKLLVRGYRISRLEKRFNVMQQRMLEDAITYREDIEMILKKLDEISNQTSEISHVIEVEVENNFQKNKPEVKDDQFIRIVKNAMKQEKQHIRNVLHEVRRKSEMMKNDFAEMETKVSENKKEQDIILGQLKLDILQITEKQKKHEDLDKKVANYSNNIKQLFNEQLENKYNELSKEIKSEKGRLNSRIDEIFKKLRILSAWSCSDSFEGWCYYVSVESLTWEEAVAECATQASNLVEVDSDAENTFLIKLAEEKGVSGFGVWLGASDKTREGAWIWETTRRDIANTYSNFISPEPNGYRKENCLHLYSGSWKWNDIRCYERMRYICERGPQFVEN